MRIGDRIRTRREEIGIQQADLAKRLGLSQSAVSQWEDGKTDPYPKRLRDIAQALDTTVRFLTDLEEGEDPIDDLSEQTPVIQYDGIIRVPRVGLIQAGLFAERNELPIEEQGFTPIPANTPFARLPLKSARIHGDSMNEFYPHGSDVVYVPAIFLGEGWMPETGHHVIIQRLNDWGESELTVKEIRYGKGENPDFVELMPRSTNPAFQKPWAYPINRTEAAGDDEVGGQQRIRIVGLVLYAVRKAPGV